MVRRGRMAHAGGGDGTVKKKRAKKFQAVQAVKELARERVGRVPATKIVPNKSGRGETKHKPTLGKLLGEE